MNVVIIYVGRADGTAGDCDKIGTRKSQLQNGSCLVKLTFIQLTIPPWYQLNINNEKSFCNVQAAKLCRWYHYLACLKGYIASNWHSLYKEWKTFTLLSLTHFKVYKFSSFSVCHNRKYESYIKKCMKIAIFFSPNWKARILMPA